MSGTAPNVPAVRRRPMMFQETRRAVSGVRTSRWLGVNSGNAIRNRFRVDPAVCAGQDRDLRTLQAIPNEVRKAVQHRATNATIQLGEYERCFREAFDEILEFDAKFSGQPGLFGFIPFKGFCNVEFSGPANIDAVAQGRSLRSRALTSDQGR